MKTSSFFASSLGCFVVMTVFICLTIALPNDRPGLMAALDAGTSLLAGMFGVLCMVSTIFFVIHLEEQGWGCKGCAEKSVEIQKLRDALVAEGKPGRPA